MVLTSRVMYEHYYYTATGIPERTALSKHSDKYIGIICTSNTFDCEHASNCFCLGDGDGEKRGSTSRKIQYNLGNIAWRRTGCRFPCERAQQKCSTVQSCTAGICNYSHLSLFSPVLQSVLAFSALVFAFSLSNQADPHASPNVK